MGKFGRGGRQSVQLVEEDSGSRISTGFKFDTANKAANHDSCESPEMKKHKRAQTNMMMTPLTSMDRHPMNMTSVKEKNGDYKSNSAFGNYNTIVPKSKAHTGPLGVMLPT